MSVSASKTRSGKHNVDLLHGPVGPSLIRMAVPMAIAMLAIMLQNLTDTWFIGMLGTEQLAAISFTFPVTFLVTALSMGIGIGLSAVVAPALGRKDHQAAARITSDALMLAVILVILLSAAGYLTIGPVFRQLGALPAQLPLIHEYMSIWYIGIAFLVIPMVGNSALRAGGNTRGPSQIMILAAVVNFVLDPLLIFGIGPFPELGIGGAAWASLLSLFTTLLAALWMLGRQEKLLTLSGFSFSDMLSHWQKVMTIGLPAALSQMLAPVAAAVITRIVSEYGSEGVAAFGVGTRIEPVAVILTMSLGSCLPAFVGQNQGAQQYGRIVEAVRYCRQFSVRAQAVIWGVLILLSGPIAGSFSDDPAVIAEIRRFLLIVPVGYFALGWAMMASNCFNALHKPGYAFVVSALRLLVFGLPLAWLGSLGWGLPGLFAGMAAGNIFAGVVSMAWLQKTISRQVSQAEPAGIKTTNPLATN